MGTRKKMLVADKAIGLGLDEPPLASIHGLPVASRLFTSEEHLARYW